jgi:transposase-like protein
MLRSARIFSRELKLSVIRRLLAGENVSALARELQVTSTAILNEKRSPDDKHRGSILNINTPRKDWGDAFRALI